MADNLPLTKEECANLSVKFQQYLYRLVLTTGNTSNPSGSGAVILKTPDRLSQTARSDRDAVIYIVVVLCFYSFGIIFMMVKYMRKEERELEEFEIYKSYLKDGAKDSSSHPGNVYQNCSRGRLANRLALQALNTVNAIPQTNQLASKVTFV